jgi:tetratricopeptide (TPR) repeat protein
MSDDLDKMFAEVVSAARQGQRARAKDLLSRLLRSDQGNAEYWVWMSAMVDSANERQYCLQQALKLNPEHAAARRGLILASGIAAEKVTPVPPPKRKWSASAELPTAEEEPKSGLAGVWQRLPPFFRARPVVIGFVVVVIFLVIGIGGCLAGILMQPSNRLPFAYNTAPPVTPNWDTDTPTPSATPTATPSVRTATATLSGLTPLSALLGATFTPTPRYIATPHNISEAYRSGLSAYDKGDYAKMLGNMQQAGTEMPDFSDVAYYQAEALRLLTRYKEALDLFNAIIKTNPLFAPAYLGRARTQLAINPANDVRKDLDLAIESDPAFLEAYLERAVYRFERGDVEGTLEDLQFIAGLNPDHPWLYLLRAQLNLQEGEKRLALDNAQRTLDLDPTLLPAYLVLGQAYLLNDQPQVAYQYIHDYLAYDKENAAAWAAMGQVYYLMGEDYPLALDALDKALELDKQLPEAYHFRGLTHLALEDAQSAVNDLVKAVQYAPQDFQTGLELGLALFAAERNTDAVNQLTASLKLAETDAQFAEIYHWRAQIYQTVGNIPSAIREWEALLALPKANVPAAWLEEARKSLIALTPTPEASETASAGSATLQPSVTAGTPALPTVTPTP